MAAGAIPTRLSIHLYTRAVEAGGLAGGAMTVYVLLREDQSENGFVDASVVGLFRSWEDADAVRESSVAEARKVGDRVCGDPGTEPDWEVCWTIESHPLL